jgi:hypothetical protein
MIDDDGDIILNQTRRGLKCDRRIHQQRFFATYDVENCKDSTAPDKKSVGIITVTATTDDGDLVVDRNLMCKK